MRFRDLTILGSGTIVPQPGHGCSGYLIRGSDAPLLLDCGPGVLYRLSEVGFSAAEIRTLLITHFHLDHVSDLAALLNSRWLQSAADDRVLELIGPAGLQAHLDWLAARMDSWFADFAFRVCEGATETCTAGGIAVASCRTGHTDESICYRLTDEAGTVVFYSGDTDYNEELVPLAEGADIAVIECSMPNEMKTPGHLTPELAAKIARLARVKTLVLTHFYREASGVDVLAQAGSLFDGRIIVARDLMRIPFGDPVLD